MAGAAGEHESLCRERAAVRRENSWLAVEAVCRGMGVERTCETASVASSSSKENSTFMSWRWRGDLG